MSIMTTFQMTTMTCDKVWPVSNYPTASFHMKFYPDFAFFSTDNNYHSAICLFTNV